VSRALAHRSLAIARAAHFRRVPELLAEFSAHADAALAAVGLARADLEDPEFEIPYLQAEELLVECERRTGCEHFALLLCAQSGLDDVGLPGRAARCGTTVGEGLSDLTRLYNLRHGGGIANLVAVGDVARLIYAMAVLETRDTHQYQMGAIATFFKVLQDLCGPEWQGSEILLAFRAPTNQRPFQRFFRVPVRFDADESAIVFDSAWLDRPLPPVDASFRQAVVDEARRARNDAFEDFPGLVRDLIRKQLSSGPSSIESLASILSMHRRTLDRRLARYGERYGALRTSVKYEIARQLLRETDLSVQQIAEFLRFSSAANFATAFRQWAGETPSEYRAREL